MSARKPSFEQLSGLLTDNNIKSTISLHRGVGNDFIIWHVFTE